MPDKNHIGFPLLEYALSVGSSASVRYLPSILFLSRLFYTSLFVGVFPILETASVASRHRTVTDLALFLQAASYSSRGFQLYDYYQFITFPPELDFHYYFVNLLPRNTSSPPNIAMPDGYLRWREHPATADREWPVREAATRFFALNYALEHTTARWI
jgi:hypothetical protein